MKLRKLAMVVFMTVGVLSVTLPAFPKTTDDRGLGKAIVTVVPVKDKQTPVNILPGSLQVKVNGKESTITDWMPLRGPHGDLELMILIDSSARASLGLQYEDISGFIRGLPADVKIAIGYMQEGRVVLTKPLSTDHAQVIDELHISGAVPRSNASPYFCLSDLARKWPSKDLSARREAILITDGVDNYNPGYDPSDPYLRSAIRDSVRAGLVVYSIYMPDRGRKSESDYDSLVGQSLLEEVSKATGGHSYWDGGKESPVSFRPFLDDIAWRLQNQYQLSFHSLLKGNTEIQNMSLKSDNPKFSIFAPQSVLITHPNAK